MSRNSEFAILEHFLEKMRAESAISLATFKAYHKDLLQFLSYIKDINLQLADLTNAVIANYIRTFLSNLKHNTVARKLSAIRQFILFLFENDIIKSQLSFVGLRAKNKQTSPKSLSLAETEKLLNIAESNLSVAGKRNCALLQIIYSTGMRISEVLSLKVNDIIAHTTKNKESLFQSSDDKFNENKDETNKTDKKNDKSAVISLEGIKEWLVITGKNSKQRIVVLHQKARESIAAYLAVRNECLPQKYRQLCAKSQILFPAVGKDLNIHPLSRQRAWLIVKNAAKLANIDPVKLSPHGIRHTFATHMLENGVDIRVLQEMLGHDSIASTQIYTHMSRAAMSTAVAQHPIASCTIDVLLQDCAIDSEYLEEKT